MNDERRNDWHSPMIVGNVHWKENPVQLKDIDFTLRWPSFHIVVVVEGRMAFV